MWTIEWTKQQQHYILDSSNCIVSYYTIRYNTKMYGSPEPIKLRCIAVNGWDSVFIIYIPR